MVTFNTRENARLDEIYTDIEDYNYVTPFRLAPILENDQCCIFLPSAYCKNQKHAYRTKRTFTPSTMHAIDLSICKENWTSVINASAIDGKVEKFHKIIDAILDKLAPWKRSRIRSDARLWEIWEIPLIKKLRRAKTRTYKKNSGAYKMLSKLLKSAILSSRRKLIDNSINKLTSGKGKWWLMLKALQHNYKSLLLRGILLKTSGKMRFPSVTTSTNTLHLWVITDYHVICRNMTLANAQ